MGKGRVEAFSDGVIAILITIMVLELRVPHGASWAVIQPVLPTILVYLLSFVFIAIYWNNHHHLFTLVRTVNGPVLWANTHLLFWLSLVPFLTRWMGENSFEPLPVALYGVVLLASGAAFNILVRVLISAQGADIRLRDALAGDIKGRLSVVLYSAGVALSFPARWVAVALYVAVALMWLIPDPRIEKTHQQSEA